MAVNGVPWAVGGGAVVDEGVARMLAYWMFNGQEGVLGALDCEVKAQTVPGNTVQVMPGGYVCRARGAGQLQESYLNKVTSATNTPTITPTSGAARSDLVYLAIEDPHIAGEPWADPPNLAIGPYTFVRVQQGVTSTTRLLTEVAGNKTGIPLARLDIPPSTATITQAMIVPLRSLVSVVTGPTPPDNWVATIGQNSDINSQKIWSDVRRGPVTPSDLTNVVTGSQVFWPNVCDYSVPIPSWATHVDVVIMLTGISILGDTHGEFIAEFVGTSARTPYTVYDLNHALTSGPASYDIMAAGEITIPVANRGKVTNLRTYAKLRTGTPTAPGNMRCFEGSAIWANLNFKQKAIASP